MQTVLTEHQMHTPRPGDRRGPSSVGRGRDRGNRKTTSLGSGSGPSIEKLFLLACCFTFVFAWDLGSGAKGLRHRPGSVPLTLEQPKLLSAVESCSRISGNQLPGADILYKTPDRMLMSTTFSHLSHFFSFKR